MAGPSGRGCLCTTCVEGGEEPYHWRRGVDEGLPVRRDTWAPESSTNCTALIHAALAGRFSRKGELVSSMSRVAVHRLVSTRAAFGRAADGRACRHAQAEWVVGLAGTGGIREMGALLANRSRPLLQPDDLSERQCRLYSLGPKLQPGPVAGVKLEHEHLPHGLQPAQLAGMAPGESSSQPGRLPVEAAVWQGGGRDAEDQGAAPSGAALEQRAWHLKRGLTGQPASSVDQSSVSPARASGDQLGLTSNPPVAASCLLPLGVRLMLHHLPCA